MRLIAGGREFQTEGAACRKSMVLSGDTMDTIKTTKDIIIHKISIALFPAECGQGGYSHTGTYLLFIFTDIMYTQSRNTYCILNKLH